MSMFDTPNYEFDAKKAFKRVIIQSLICLFIIIIIIAFISSSLDYEACGLPKFQLIDGK